MIKIQITGKIFMGYVYAILIASLIVLGYASHYYWRSCEQCELYRITASPEGTVPNGIWYGEGYYCVWTKGRNAVDINDTETHEQCHELVHRDPQHFCGKVNLTKEK